MAHKLCANLKVCTSATAHTRKRYRIALIVVLVSLIRIDFSLIIFLSRALSAQAEAMRVR
jgi:hypothetical protein